MNDIIGKIKVAEWWDNPTVDSLSHYWLLALSAGQSHSRVPFPDRSADRIPFPVSGEFTLGVEHMD